MIKRYYKDALSGFLTQMQRANRPVTRFHMIGFVIFASALMPVGLVFTILGFVIRLISNSIKFLISLILGGKRK